MQMTFGDWELFRTLVTILREKNAAMVSIDISSSSDSLGGDAASPAHGFKPLKDVTKQVKPLPQYVQQAGTANDSMQAARNMQLPPPELQDLKTAPPRTDDSRKDVVTSAQQIDDDAEIVAIAERRQARVDSSSGGGVDGGANRPLGRTRRNDSMAVDVMHEAQYLHQLMDAAGWGEDLSEEESGGEEDDTGMAAPEVSTTFVRW